jgi:uncharacterized membrane protein YgaE (UPF0421/DUF939 family)
VEHLHIKHHWIGRIIASDPGLKRLTHAGKAVISLISSFFTMLFIFHMNGSSLLTPAVVSGMVGMLGILIVMDDTKKKKKVTTLLLGVSAALGITFGSLLAGNAYYIGGLMLFFIFSAFYFSRYGSRYFSISMIGFMTVYISSLLKLDTNQLLWFYVGISIGVAYAFFYNFLVFKDSAQMLKRSMRSFHIQANLTFNILIKMIQDTEISTKQRKTLKKNIIKLSEYARNVSGDINQQDVDKVWPGLEPSQLRLYVFDTAMLIETLADSIRRLKKAHALETEELEKLIVWVVKSLRDAKVLAQNYEKGNLEDAEKAIQAIRCVLYDLLNQEQKPEGWLFLIRRIESIANHVIEGAIAIQNSLFERRYVEGELIGKAVVSEESSVQKKEKEKGIKPTTKKAYQALVAGIISIFVGHIISPSQPYWIVLTAFIVLLGTESVGRTYIKGFQRSVGTIIGAILGFGLAKLVSGHSVLEVILLFLVVFFAFYLFSVSYTLMSLFITLLIAFVYDILLGGISLSLLGARVIDTVAGAVIALGASAMILPKKTKDMVADSFEAYLSILNSYVTDYVRSFIENISVKALADNTFDLDQKLQAIKDQAQSLLQRPGAHSNSGLVRSITIFTAINYFAKHLVASSYKKNFDYPEELLEDFKEIEEKLGHNIDELCKLIKGTKGTSTVYNLSKEREILERLAPSRSESHRDLIHHLYYVWRINQSIVLLSTELGAEEK